MIIDQFNTTLSGGAAIAARRLHHALLESGNTSRFWHLGHKQQTVDNDESYISAKYLWNRKQNYLLSAVRKQFHKLKMRRSLRGRPSGLEIFSSPRTFPPTRIDAHNLSTDIIQLHWIVKLIDYPSFFSSIPEDVPIVWTLHDMNPFTGGCHHADDCRRFTSICHYCPQLGRPGSQDVSRQNYEIKQQAFSRKNIHIVTPSRWLESHVRQSALLESVESVQTIRNGLDTNLFAPHNRAAARKRFGLSENDFVIGCGAAQLTNERKGFRELLNSFALLRNRKRCIGLAMGDGQLPNQENSLKLQSTGYLEKQEDIIDFYSALDVFVITSKAENMPQTVVEAMACGIPTVGFAVGGIPEIVQPGRTGLLSPVGNCNVLAQHIDSLIEWPEGRTQMGIESRNLAVLEFNEQQQLQKYLQLYQRAIARSKERRLVA